MNMIRKKTAAKEIQKAGLTLISAVTESNNISLWREWYHILLSQ